MANTIKEQITEAYVGEVVELFVLDTTPIGGSMIYRYTPSSHTPISFSGHEYIPLPIAMQGLDRNLDSAPGRVALTLSSMNSMIFASIISLGDLVGARVTYIRTFKNFLDGQPQGGSNQSFPVQRFVIYQKTMFSPQGIEFILTTEIDRPNVMLPLRQCLKSDVGINTLYCPGMQRTRLR